MNIDKIDKLEILRRPIDKQGKTKTRVNTWFYTGFWTSLDWVGGLEPPTPAL
jgi:hypothetical protein